MPAAVDKGLSALLHSGIVRREPPVQTSPMTPNEILAALQSGAFDSIAEHGDESFRADVSPEQMRDAWLDAGSRWGEMLAADAAVLLHDVPLRFQRGEAHLQVAYRDDRIVGLILLPGQPTARFGD